MHDTTTDRRTDAPTNTTDLTTLVRERQEQLEALAESDLNVAWAAEALLAAADAEETGE